MRVRVIPVHRGTILKLELVLVRLAGSGDDEPIAVVACIVVQAVPLNDRRFVELVQHAHAHLVAAASERSRIEKRLAAGLDRVREIRRALPGRISLSACTTRTSRRSVARITPYKPLAPVRRSGLTKALARFSMPAASDTCKPDPALVSAA